MKNQPNAKKITDKDFSYINAELKKFIENLEKENATIAKKNKCISRGVNESLINILKASLLSNGKRIRPLFCFWIFRYFCNLPKTQQSHHTLAKKIALSIEIIHNASLILDDIEDNSDTRRGAPALHSIYGISTTLNTGSWMYFLAIDCLPTNLHGIAVNALADCHIGQGIDLAVTQKNLCQDFFHVSSKERWEYYEKCVSLKTSRLILLALDLFKKPFLIKPREYKFIKNLIIQYGMIYQLFDDLKNIFSELSENKMHEDLKSGLRSAISLTFLDLLNHNEVAHAHDALIKNNFFEYMHTHLKFNQALHLCFEKAEKLHKKVLDYADAFLSKHLTARQYLSFLFETPFLEIKKHIAQKLSNGA